MNAMYALQKALRQRIAAGLGWLTIRRYPSRPDVLPWFWAEHQKLYAAHWNSLGRPFVSGPCMVFKDARAPRIDAEECAILDARHCRLMFCHSGWYRDLLAKHRGPMNAAPIVPWPAPIDPWPEGPRVPRVDLLIYAKSGYDPALIDRLRALFPRSIVLIYGGFQRNQLYEAAAYSRACAYLSDNDHGPLALQEILLAGCPTVGVPRGAPYVQPGSTGFLVERLPSGVEKGDPALADYLDALTRARSLDRQVVREVASESFSTVRIVDGVLEALDVARSRVSP